MTTPTHTTNPLDLTWVEFSEDEAEPCMAIGGCDKEATWKATYNWSCECWPADWYFCEADGNALREAYGEGIFDKDSAVCKTCGSPSYLVKIVRWKKGQ